MIIMTSRHTDMKHSIKVTSLRLLLKSTYRLCINVAHITKDGEPRTPVRVSRHCSECIQTAPGAVIATVVDCATIPNHQFNHALSNTANISATSLQIIIIVVFNESLTNCNHNNIGK